jgi:K+-sensing histidine kinase KdpD
MSAHGPLQLLSLAAHELRTPANVIGGALRLLRTAGQDREDVRRQALAQAERSYERLVELLAEMSDLWRLEEGQAVFNRQRLEIGPLLASAAQLAATQLRDETASVADTSALATASVRADPTRLERTFLALFLAVARFRADQHQPVVARAAAIAAPPASVRVVFALGSAPDPADEPRHRQPLDEFESGLGLAIPIARRVIEAEGGRTYAWDGGKPPVLAVELPVAAS